MDDQRHAQEGTPVLPSNPREPEDCRAASEVFAPEGNKWTLRVRDGHLTVSASRLLCLITDSEQTLRHVGYWPQADYTHPHSMSWSVRSSGGIGTLRPLWRF